jgi:predicted metalloprotease with PDZ domain
MSRRLLSSSIQGAVVCVLLEIVAPSAAADVPQPIVYSVKVSAPATHLADVTATLPTEGRASIQIMMPVWSPGFYRVENYATRVKELSAHAPDGSTLAVTQPRKNRWQIQTGDAASIVVSYRVVCNEHSVTTNWVGPDFEVLNGPATFVTLVEQRQRPHEVQLQLPPEWKQSMTGLDKAPDGLPNHYRAADFDTLVDSPIIAGNPAISAFEVDGSRHYLVCVGDVSHWDGQRATRDVEKLVRANKQMWGFLPFKHYVFLFVLRQGGGGLEHKNSTLIVSGPSPRGSPTAYSRWLGLVSHEYFHAYNVKRLRPIELGPFDYEKEVHTPSLWIAEGLTSYYGDLLVSRAGVAERDYALSRLSAEIKQLQTSPGRLVQTLEQASNEVWTSSFSGVGSNPKTVSYYVKGPVVGFLLDAHIRRTTGGSKSLDDLMRFAYQRYSGQKGFTAEQFRQAAEEIAGTDLKEWFRKAIASTEELDYTEALDWFGLRFTPSGAGRPANSWQLEILPKATATQKQHLNEWLGTTGR